MQFLAFDRLAILVFKEVYTNLAKKMALLTRSRDIHNQRCHCAHDCPSYPDSANRDAQHSCFASGHIPAMLHLTFPKTAVLNSHPTGLHKMYFLETCTEYSPSNSTFPSFTLFGPAHALGLLLLLLFHSTATESLTGFRSRRGHDCCWKTKKKSKDSRQ